MSAYAELNIDQGADFVNVVTLTDDVTSNNINLVTYSAHAKIKKSYYSMNTSANIICTMTDAPNGEITMAISSANTSNLKPGRYVYDLTITENTSSVTSRVLEGIVFVNPKVT